MAGNLYIVAAPSGAGKTSLVRALVERVPGIAISVSHTTRPPRPNDRDGVDYYFLTEAEFKQKAEAGDFLEHAEVHGCFYGTSKSWVLKQLEAGTDIILEIDWQGAALVSRLMPDAVSIFIFPPSMAVLSKRLHARGQDDQAVIDSRLAAAKAEMQHFADFKYLVLNDDFEVALDDLSSVVRAERLLLDRQQQNLSKLLADLLD